MDKKITITDMSNFIAGNTSMYLNRENIPLHVREQILYRALRCATCTYNGKCIHCGCPTPNMFFAPHKQDSERKWPAKFIINEDEWNKYKRGLSPSLESLKETYPDLVEKINKLWNK